MTTIYTVLSWDVFVTRGIPIVTRDRPAGVQETQLRREWIAALDKIESLNPRAVIAFRRAIARWGCSCWLFPGQDITIDG
jgi:hypothetical protein